METMEKKQNQVVVVKDYTNENEFDIKNDIYEIFEKFYLSNNNINNDIIIDISENSYIESLQVKKEKNPDREKIISLFKTPFSEDIELDIRTMKINFPDINSNVFKKSKIIQNYLMNTENDLYSCYIKTELYEKTKTQMNSLFNRIVIIYDNLPYGIVKNSEYNNICSVLMMIPSLPRVSWFDKSELTKIFGCIFKEEDSN